MTLRRIFTITMLSLAVAAGGFGRGWEPVKTERNDTKGVVRENELEIKSAPGIIQISTNHPVQIKIFTILGRLISSETVNPGIQQFQVPTHGVYIVQTGTLTCKVAV